MRLMRLIINLLRGNGSAATKINRRGGVKQYAKVGGHGKITQVAGSGGKVTQVAKVHGNGSVTQVGGNSTTSRRSR